MRTKQNGIRYCCSSYVSLCRGCYRQGRRDGGGSGGHHTPPWKKFCRQILLLVGKPCDLLRSLAPCLQILQFVRARVILQNRCPAFCLHYRINVRTCCRHIPWFIRFYEKGFQHAVGIILSTAHPTIPTQPWNFSAMQTRMKNVTANQFFALKWCKTQSELIKVP